MVKKRNEIYLRINIVFPESHKKTNYLSFLYSIFSYLKLSRFLYIYFTKKESWITNKRFKIKELIEYNYIYQKNTKMTIDPFIKEYIILALRINKLFDGYIDAYYGSPKFKKMVESEPIKSPKQLIKTVKSLQKDLSEAIDDPARQNYLRAILGAMETFLKVLDGENIDFFEQIETILGIKPDLFKDDEFYDLQEQFNEAYLGVGTLAEKMESYKERRYIPQNHVIPYFKKALEITRSRTRELFPDLLPETESYHVQFTKERVGWAMYNKYQGNFHSLIEINPSQPYYWTTFFPLAAHEGYPGHHTELAVKNKLLHDKLNWNEHCLVLMNTPVGVIIEGIAETAPYILFSPIEKFRIEIKEFCPNPIEEDSVETLIKQFELKYKLKKFKIHLTNLTYIEGLSKKELIDYGMTFGFTPKANLESDIDFILNPKYRIVHYTYNYGRALISKKFGFPPNLDDFKYLLSNPVISSDLV